jgi:ferredoxin
MAVDARCRRCVEACPSGAWLIDDAVLGLDSNACDGCGLCVPACPTAAISIPRADPVPASDDPATALLACGDAVVQGGRGVARCLNAFGSRDVAGLAARGVTRLVVARGACDTCRLGPGRAWDDAVAEVIRLQNDRGQRAISVVAASPQSWVAARDRALRPSRRDLFAALRSGRASASPGDDAVSMPAAARLPGGGSAETLHPYFPVIAADLCDGCDACVKLCPHDVLRQEETPPNTAVYIIEASRCSGCDLCIDVCEAGAIAVQRWQHGPTVAITFTMQRCASCGRAHKVPAGLGEDGAFRCRICRRADHNRNLFQVLE